MCQPLPPSSSRQRTAGFTLPEVLIALVILTTGLVGLGGMQVMAMKLNSRSHNASQLATVAQEQMEHLLTLPAAAVVLQDADNVLGQGTTRCVLYPPEGIRACADRSFRTFFPSPNYCRVTTQGRGTACADSNFPPPTIGYKVAWTIDRDTVGTLDPSAQLAHITITVSQKAEGKYVDPDNPTEKDKTYKLSFARFYR